ncbi:23_t:CDS:2 [Funneliformis caledonium]|uniref:23_t:CDS:1 n=1 Tax=Funneliformis caledonium TaxID=1117310 RepID=A0A9N9BPY0_9GLOM|nr:23_t:CDS:2 [Funneliformis caledonium]
MVKFTFSLLLIGIVSLVRADFEVETNNNGFVPSSELRSIYSQKTASKTKTGGHHKAEIYFKTKVPSFNPDQSGVVSDIKCGDDKITLSLNDKKSIEQVDNWPDKVMLLISHKWECFGKSTTQFYMVRNKTVDAPKKKVSFTTESCDPLEWSDEFLVEISWENGKTNKRNARHRDLNKRGRLNRRQDEDKPKLPIDVSEKLDLNVLFDEKTGKSSKPNFPLVEAEQDNTSESLVCANCFMSGEATISMRIAGKVDPKIEINEASISLNGKIKMNFDLSLNGKLGTVISPPDLQLLNLPLNPISIPNVFNIGPSLILTASAKISADVTGNIYAGSEINLPNFNVKATLLDEPKVEQSGFEPETKSHDPSVGVTGSTDITSSLKPQLALNIDVLNGAFGVKTGIQLVTTLGTTISVGKESGCKGKTQPHIETTLEAIDEFGLSILVEHIQEFFINNQLKVDPVANLKLIFENRSFEALQDLSLEKRAAHSIENTILLLGNLATIARLFVMEKITS